MRFTKNKALNLVSILIILILAISGISIVVAGEISIIAKPSVTNSGYEHIWYKTSFDNYCPVCKSKDSLIINPKKTYEVELTCSKCGADYCGVNGREKIPKSKRILVKTKATVLSSIPGISRDRNNLTIEGIKDASTRLKKFINTNKKLPNWVVIDDLQHSMGEYTYFSSKAIVKMSKYDNSNIKIIIPKNTAQSGSHAQGTITKSNTIDLSIRVSVYIEKNKKLPSYANVKIGSKNVKMKNKDIIYLFADTIDKSRSTNKLPSKVSVNTKKPLIK